MKTFLIALGVAAVASWSAFAAEPAKMVDTKVGKVMTTDTGITLYTFDKDTQGQSNCDADCLKK